MKKEYLVIFATVVFFVALFFFRDKSEEPNKIEPPCIQQTQPKPDKSKEEALNKEIAELNKKILELQKSLDELKKDNDSQIRWYPLENPNYNNAFRP